MSELIVLGGAFVPIALMTLGVLALYGRMYIKVPSGQALILIKMASVEVFFTGGLAIPILHKSEFMDINAKFFVIERSGPRGVICKDGIRADVWATFCLRVNKTSEDVLRVAQLVGADRAMLPETLAGLFTAKFSEALESFVAGKTFADLLAQRSEFGEAMLEELGADLQGYTLDAMAIDRVEQTPIHHLDEDNILDAQGILAITRSTTAAQAETAKIRAAHRRRMKELETESKDLLIELETRRARGLNQLRAETGIDLTNEQLEDRLLDRLRQLISQA